MLTHRSNTFFLLSGLITWAIIRFFYPVSGIFPVILLMLWLLMATVGSFTIRMNYHLEGYHENPASADIALTFDDGPTEYTVQVLDLLQTYRAKATFFLIGRQAEKYPELVRRMLAEGHTVGNHTWSHSPRTGFMRAGEMEKEIRAADRILESWVRGKVKFYRPPFGVTNPSVRKAVQATGHALMGWSVRSLDTVIRDERKIVKRILRMLRPGSVVLLHDTSQKSVNVLRQLLEELENRSLRPVTLDQLFDIHAYEKI